MTIEEIIQLLEAKGYYVRRALHPSSMGFDSLYIRSSDGFPYVLNVAHGGHTAELLIHLAEQFAGGDYETTLIEASPRKVISHL